MISILLGCGLRRAELACLRREDVQIRQGHWAIVDLVGKGGRIRTVPMPLWVKSAVDRWTTAATVTDGRVFRAISSYGITWGKGISENVVWYVVHNCAQRVELDHLAPHDLRRTCAKLCHVKPHSCSHATPEAIENAILALRGKYPSWGARKLKAKLEQLDSSVEWPVASTFGNILQRAGLTSPKRKKRRTTPYSAPFSEVTAPNQLWCMDFKGYFATGDGSRCDPFTITDAHSRYLIRCQIVSRMDLSQVRAVCEAAMREYGMPSRIRTDNGAPFAGTGLLGLSKLSLGWMKMGIIHERIQPGRPQQNGRHERMHRTLKEETTRPAALTLRLQQKKFDRFREVFNYERPHEGLNNATPGSVYQPSSVLLPRNLIEFVYPKGFMLRRVNNSGDISWHKGRVFISEVFRFEVLGLEQVDEEFYKVYFRDVEIGEFDAEVLRFRPVQVMR